MAWSVGKVILVETTAASVIKKSHGRQKMIQRVKERTVMENSLSRVVY